jgi:outer membrane protein TolC
LGIANLPTNSFSFTQEPMTGKIIGLSQGVPFPGKLSAVEKVQLKDIEINQQEIDDKINEIRNEVSQVYYDLRFTREALRIAHENEALLKKICCVSSKSTKYYKS